MAKLISLVSGSLFCDNPIVVEVISENVMNNVVFHHVVLEVRAALSSDGVFVSYKSSIPAGNGEAVLFDISSILRSVGAKASYVPTQEDCVYPYMVYELKAYDEYLLDGILYEKQGERDGGGQFYSLIGGFTDIERLLAGDSKSAERFSRKPSVGEVCAESECLLIPQKFHDPISIGSVLESGPTVKAYSLAGLSGLKTFEGHSVYVVPNSPYRMSFQFVNGLGVVESVSAEVRKSKTYEITSKTDVFSGSSSFFPKRRLISRNGNPVLVLKMSSGAVNEDWADWWVNEFLASNRGVWIRLDDIWLPCVVMPEDSITVFDESKNELISINFTVKLSLTGSGKNLI